MKYRLAFILWISLSGISMLCAQPKSNLSLHFHPQWAQMPLRVDEGNVYTTSNGDSVEIGLLKFYVSGVELWKNGAMVWKEENSFHLIDASDVKSLDISAEIPENIDFTHLKFYLGIDAATNESGAMGGDLDPTKGMYWTWQSGYINFKVEGKSPRCPTRNHAFQFHLGGYQAPNNALQTVILEAKNRTRLDIVVDVAAFLSDIDLSAQNRVMSPSPNAVLLSQKVAHTFSIR